MLGLCSRTANEARQIEAHEEETALFVIAVSLLVVALVIGLIALVAFGVVVVMMGAPQ